MDADCRVQELTGVNVRGFKVAIEARQLQHIINDHGKSGKSDQSMSNPEDIARIGYVLNNPDAITKSGKTQAYSYMKNGRNRTADTVLYEKNIGDKSYYAVQAIPDTKAKTLYIVTAFIGQKGYKKGVSQLINTNGPDATSKIGSAITPNDSISQSGENVNRKVSTYFEQSAELANMGENGVQIMYEVYDGSADPVKFFEAYNRVYAAGKRGGQARGRDMSLLGENAANMTYKAGQMDALKNGGKSAQAYRAGENARAAAQSETPAQSETSTQSQTKTEDLLGTVQIPTLDSNKSYYRLDDLGISEADQAAWIAAGIAQERNIRGETFATVNTSVLQDELRRRENSSSKVLQKDGGSDTIESTQSRRENSDGQTEQQRKQPGSDRGAESGTAKIQGGTREADGGRSRVQETVGRIRTEDSVSASRRPLGLNHDGSQTPFNIGDTVELPQNNSIYVNQQRIINEYGVDCYIIKQDAWDVFGPGAEAGAFKGKVYISENIDSELAEALAPHEGTHIMKQLDYQAYLDFIDKTPGMIDFSQRETEQLLSIIAKHIGVDFLSMTDSQAARLYDEMNAAIYGFYKTNTLGDTEFADLVSIAIPDFDSYIAELDSIHEQYKQEVKERKLNSQQTKENAIEPERVVYSSNTAKAYDAIPRDKLSKEQRRVVDVGAQIGRKVIFAVTVNKNGVEVDGFIAKNGDIYINPNKNVAPMAFVFKHELAHFAERAGQKYRDFMEAVQFSTTFKGWLKEKGYNSMHEYNSQMRKERSDVGIDPGEDGANNEIIANFVAEMLFGGGNSLTENLIRELSPKQRKSVREYIREFFSWIKGKFVGDAGKAAFEVRKLEKLFANAYQEAVKSRANLSGESFSLSANAKTDLHKALYDLSYRSDVRLRDATPDIMLQQKGVRNLPMVMKASHIRENVFSDTEAKRLGLRVSDKTHYHDLGEAFFLQVIDGLDDVVEAYRGTKNANNPSRRENYFLLISTFKDKNGDTINVPVYIDEHADVNKVFIDVNKISTVFGKENLRDYINTQVRNGNLVRIKRSIQPSERYAPSSYDYGKDTSITSDKSTTSGLQLPHVVQTTSGVNNSISNSNEKYNSQNAQNSDDQTEQFSYTPQNDKVENSYTQKQYNDFGWVRDNNVISAGYWKNFTENFAQAVAGNYSFPKTKNGEFMIEVYDAYDNSGVADVIVFASGTIESPNVSKIVKIDLTQEIDIEAKRSVLYEAERRGIQQEAGGVFRFYNKADFISKLRHQRAGNERNGNNHRLDTKRSRSEVKANRIVKFHVDEYRGIVTTTYANGETVTEKLNDGEDDVQFSYTPQNEKIDDVLDRVASGELTLDEAKKLLKKPEGDNPATIANLKPEDMGTTPRVSKKTNGNVGDSDSRFAGSVQRSSIFNEDFKKEVGEDNFVKHYASITNKETLAEAAKRLDEGGEAYVTEWLSKNEKNPARKRAGYVVFSINFFAVFL